MSETGLSAMGDRLLYAHPSEVSRGEIDRAKPVMSDNTDGSGLINEELSGSMPFY